MSIFRKVPTKSSAPKGLKKILREWVEALLFAFVIAFVFRTWIYAPFRVPTGSMIPTINVGDHIMADMSAYGYQIPFTDYRILEKQIQRGDVVIFPSPLNPVVCDSNIYSAYDTFVSLVVGFVKKDYVPTCMDFIKRVVAVEGDTIEFSGEDFLVNGEKEKNYVPFYNPYLPPVMLFFKDQMPKNSVFTMGDNRRDSLDGRFWHIDNQVLSYVSRSKVRAKAKWIYFSMDPQKSIFNGIQWNRMFTAIK